MVIFNHFLEIHYKFHELVGTDRLKWTSGLGFGFSILINPKSSAQDGFTKTTENPPTSSILFSANYEES